MRTAETSPSGPFNRMGLSVSVRPKRHASGGIVPPTVSLRAARRAARVFNERRRLAVSRMAANSRRPRRRTSHNDPHCRIQGRAARTRSEHPAKFRDPRPGWRNPKRAVPKRAIRPGRGTLKLEQHLQGIRNQTLGEPFRRKLSAVFCKDQPINGPLRNDRSNC